MPVTPILTPTPPNREADANGQFYVCPGKTKPGKPYPDFPLFPHATGRWAKKIRGKFCYFGPWDDPDGALGRYLDQKDALHAGRTPRVAGDGLTVRELANRFLNAKRQRVDSGELVLRTWRDYHDSCGRVVAMFGERLVDDLAGEDFGELRASLAKTRGPVALGNQVQRIRVLFKFAYDECLIDKPIRYGQSFQKPSRKAIRKAHSGNGPRMFEAGEIRRMLEAASVQLRGMIYLGINCALGNTDCGSIPTAAVDLEAGWIDFPRTKTGVPRRCPLWPETVEAVREAILARPAARSKGDGRLVFLTKAGAPWVDSRVSNNPVARATTKLLKRLGVHRTGLSFYGLRRSFLTVAEETGDFPAVGYIMGHSDVSMASHYRERIGDDRLHAVVGHVRAWLFEEITWN